MKFIDDEDKEALKTYARRLFIRDSGDEEEDLDELLDSKNKIAIKKKKKFKNKRNEKNKQ